MLPSCPRRCGPASGAGLCSGFHVHGKRLGFHLSGFMNKFMRRRSSWLGLRHAPAGPRSLLPASRGCRGRGGGSAGRCSALQKVLGWGRCSHEPGERFSSRKDPFPSVLAAEEEWWPLIGCGSAFARCITHPESLPILQRMETTSTEGFGKKPNSLGKGQGAGQGQEVSQQPPARQSRQSAVS